MKNIASEADLNIGMPTHHSKTVAELLDKLDAHNLVSQWVNFGGFSVGVSVD